METPENPYEQAMNHLFAARTLLAKPAAQARRLSNSGSPHARTEADQIQQHVVRLRSRLTGAVNALRVLEAMTVRGQAWHDRYEQVNGR